MTPQRLNKVMHHAYLKPFKVQSDFARSYAQEIAMLSFLGFLTTKEAKGGYGRSWRLTDTGYKTLEVEGWL